MFDACTTDETRIQNIPFVLKDKREWIATEKIDGQSGTFALVRHKRFLLRDRFEAPKVQGNKYKVASPDLYVFNLIYPAGRVDSIRAKSICENHGLNFVPILQTDYILPDTVNEVLEYAHGESVIGNTIREGVVFRSKDGKQSFKAVDPLFLIKYNE